MNILGHSNPALQAFLKKYQHNKVPVKHSHKRRHDGTRYKPETGRLIVGNFDFV